MKNCRNKIEFLRKEKIIFRKLVIAVSMILCVLVLAVNGATLQNFWEGKADLNIKTDYDLSNSDYGGPNLDFMSAVWHDDVLYGYGIIRVGTADSWEVNLSTSTDGINFTDRGRVLRLGASGTWDDWWVAPCGVWKDDDGWKMVYEGHGWYGGAIGLATSTDGINWTKSGSNPILIQGSSGTWDDEGIGTPSLWREGNTWYVFYHGFNGSDCQIGVATGSSLTNVTKYAGNPIVPTVSGTWEAGTCGARSIIKEGDYYYMAYEGSTDQNPHFFDADWSSGLARSTNLLSWTKYSSNPVLPVDTSYGFGYCGPTWMELPTEQVDAEGDITGLYLRYCGGDVYSRATLEADESILGWWKFDETSGTNAADSSGNDNDGTKTGAAWDDGRIDGALDFQGADYVSIPSGSLSSISDQITIAFWQYGVLPNPWANYVFEGRNAANNKRIISLHLPWSNNQVCWAAGNGGGSEYDNDYASKTASTSDYGGKWNHWAFVKNNDTGKMKIYLNGDLWHSVSGKTKSMAGIASFRIASTVAGGCYYQGLLDDFRVYSRELGAHEIFNIAKDPPVGWWKFDETSGINAADSSGNDYDGTKTGATWDDGRIDGALDFEGSDYVSIPSGAFSTISDQVTIALWQYGDTAMQPQNDFVFEGTNANGNRIFCSHLPWSSGVVYWDAGYGVTYGDRITKTASTSEYEGKWNHWAFVKNNDTGEMKIYLNGTLWHSGSGYTFSMAGVTTFKIGSNASGAWGHYDGWIDDFRVYNRQLGPKEIYRIANEPPVGWWKFDETSGTNAADSSGNGYNGTVTGAQWSNDALDFDGADYVSISSGAFSSISDQITIAIWQWGDLPNPWANCIFEGYDAVNTERVLASHLPWNSDVVYWIAGKGNNDYTYKTASASNYGGQWNHWVFVRDVPKRRMKMYLNGDLWHSANCNKTTMEGITAFKIGSTVAGGCYYQGLIDDFRVYRRALTDSDIEELSNE